jgi:hypothetical protein
MAGYSGTPLVKKLGIKEQHRLVALDAPAHFAKTLGALPDGVKILNEVAATDVAVAFFLERKKLAAALKKLGKAVFPDGALWIAWPKKASKVATDITEDVVRELALPLGLVDNKVCAIDETWSGLRLVWRLSERTK